MYQLNRLGHDFHVQVKREVHLRKSPLFSAWRAVFSEAIPGQTLFCRLHSVVPLLAHVSTPTPDEHESFLVTHHHLKTILLVGVEILTWITKPCRINGPSTFVRRLTPRVATRQMGADSHCASSVLVLCAAVERASLSQSYAGHCAVEQACESKVTLILVTEPRPPTITQLAWCLILEQEVLSGRECPAIPWTLQWRWRLRLSCSRIPRARLLHRRHAQSTCANDQGLLDVT